MQGGRGELGRKGADLLLLLVVMVVVYTNWKLQYALTAVVHKDCVCGVSGWVGGGMGRCRGVHQFGWKEGGFVAVVVGGGGVHPLEVALCFNCLCALRCVIGMGRCKGGGVGVDRSVWELIRCC